MAAASRVSLPSLPLSAMAMLRESSSTTAITFCCGANSATVTAGCQSKTSTVRWQMNIRLQQPHHAGAPLGHEGRSARRQASDQMSPPSPAARGDDQ